MSYTGTSKTVYISVCTKDRPEWFSVMGIQLAIQEAAKKRIQTILAPRIGESLICRARQNDLVEFIRSRADFLLSIDDDVEIPKHTIWKLVEDDKDIVGGVYRLKNINTYQMAVRIPDATQWPNFLRHNALTPAIYVSTGCMMVKRSCVEDMIVRYPELEYRRNVTNDPAWALYMPMIWEKEYLSEDWAFCRRALQIGKEVWVDCSVKTAHWMRHRLEIDSED